MRTVDRVVSALLCAIGQAISIYFLTARILNSPTQIQAYTRLTLLARIRKYSVANWLLSAAFVTCWLFFVMVANIEIGGSYAKPKVCHVAYYCVVSFYAITKFFTYTFLVERAHIVRGGDRRQDKLYWLNCAVLLGFVALAISPLIVTHTHVTNAGCHLGVARPITITLVVYDLFASTFWALQFLLPILKVATFRSRAFDMSSSGQKALRSLAFRTFVATSATCLVTAINVIHEIIFNEREEAWIPLLTFAIESLLCCIILHFSTTGKRTERLNHQESALTNHPRCHCSMADRDCRVVRSKAEEDPETICNVSRTRTLTLDLEDNTDEIEMDPCADIHYTTKSEYSLD